MAELLDVQRIYGDGLHNAFTDLLKWRDHYYLCFRTAETHGIEPPGDIIVLRSADLGHWEQCGRLSTGGDDRDPKLIDAGDRLGVVFGTWTPRWADGSIPNCPHDMISHLCFSHDGTSWSTPRQVWGPGYWLWRVFPDGGGFFCPAYHFPSRNVERTSRSIHLLQSEDLLNWRLVTVMREAFDSGEPALYRPAPDTLHCVLRATQPDNHSWLGRSTAPYTQWEWTDLGVMIQAPVVIQMGGQWLVAGRSQEQDLPEGAIEPTGSRHTSLWAIEGDRAVHLLTVPSAGDCSYCGLATGPGGELVMSYYSQHERMPLPEGPPTASDIFLARIQI